MAACHWLNTRRLAANDTVGPLARPREADIGQPALFLEAGQALVVERALVGEQAFLPARQEHRVELQPLGGVQAS